MKKINLDFFYFNYFYLPGFHNIQLGQDIMVMMKIGSSQHETQNGIEELATQRPQAPTS